MSNSDAAWICPNDITSARMAGTGSPMLHAHTEHFCAFCGLSVRQRHICNTSLMQALKRESAISPQIALSVLGVHAFSQPFCFHCRLLMFSACLIKIMADR